MEEKKAFKIVITITPNSNFDEIQNVVKEKVDEFRYFFRVNGSHSQLKWLSNLPDFLLENLIFDFPYRKLRIGTFEGKRVKCGEVFYFSEKKKEGSVPVAGLSLLCKDVLRGSILVVDDGYLEFIIRDVFEDRLLVESLSEGFLEKGMGVWVKSIKVYGDIFDHELFQNVRKLGISRFMISYVDSSSFLDKIFNRKELFLIAKIEDTLGYENLNEIMENFDAICVARGDLGANMEFPDWIEASFDVVKRSKLAGKSVFLAGETFVSSIYRDGKISRSEISDFYNFLNSGIDGVILSDETVFGKNIDGLLNSIKKLVTLWKAKR